MCVHVLLSTLPSPFLLGGFHVRVRIPPAPFLYCPSVIRWISPLVRYPNRVCLMHICRHFPHHLPIFLNSRGETRPKQLPRSRIFGRTTIRQGNMWNRSDSTPRSWVRGLALSCRLLVVVRSQTNLPQKRQTYMYVCNICIFVLLW